MLNLTSTSCETIPYSKKKILGCFEVILTLGSIVKMSHMELRSHSQSREVAESDVEATVTSTNTIVTTSPSIVMSVSGMTSVHGNLGLMATGGIRAPPSSQQDSPITCIVSNASVQPLVWSTRGSVPSTLINPSVAGDLRPPLMPTLSAAPGWLQAADMLMGNTGNMLSSINLGRETALSDDEDLNNSQRPNVGRTSVDTQPPTLTQPVNSSQPRITTLPKVPDVTVNQGGNIDETRLQRNLARAVEQAAQGVMVDIMAMVQAQPGRIQPDEGRVQPQGEISRLGAVSKTPKLNHKGPVRTWPRDSSSDRDVPRKGHDKKVRKKRVVDTSDSSEGDTDLDEDLISLSSSPSYKPRRRKNTRLPPFTGKETWKVWYNRFSDVAARHDWGEDEMLDELLPRLQGPAGEFVFGQLSKRVRGSFKLLTKELKNRFRKVETAKTYKAKFSSRDQKPGEGVEEYAAELKRLYDKAHSRRDAETRREDLLRRFLDGLDNEQAQFHVEYVKEPCDIDEAVYEVVNFLETRKYLKAPDGNDKRAKRPVRGLKDKVKEVEIDDTTEDEGCTGDRAARTAGKPKTPIFPSPNNGEMNAAAQVASRDLQNNGPLEEIKKLLEGMNSRLEKVEQVSGKGTKGRGNNQSPSSGGPQGSSRQNQKQGQSVGTRTCYRCFQPGHFIKDCPYQLAMTPMQMPPQPLVPQPSRQPVTSLQAADAGGRVRGNTPTSAISSTNAPQQSN